MYKIIGADQKEYGPVPADQVRKWIAERRANALTKARAEGGNDWKSLSDFAEFAESLTAQATAARPSPPKIGALDAEKFAAEIMARDYRVDIGDCFSRSWNLVKDNFWLLVGATALISVISLGMQFIPVLGHAAGVLFGFLLWGGLDLLFLKRLRGQPAEAGDVFAGFGLAFGQLMLGSVVAHVLTGIGLLLCILPGIYLLVAWWMFAPLLIIDKGLEFWPAMELSRKVVNKHWWACFGLLILTFLVGCAGVLALVVGVFVTLPIALGATVCAYQDIFGARPATSESPSPSLTAPVPSPAPTARADAGATPMTQPEADSNSSALSPDIGSKPAPSPETNPTPEAPPPTAQT